MAGQSASHSSQALPSCGMPTLVFNFLYGFWDKAHIFIHVWQAPYQLSYYLSSPTAPEVFFLNDLLLVVLALVFYAPLFDLHGSQQE